MGQASDAASDICDNTGNESTDTNTAEVLVSSLAPTQDQVNEADEIERIERQRKVIEEEAKGHEPPKKKKESEDGLWISRTEVAKRLGINRDTLSKRIREDRGGCVLII